MNKKVMILVLLSSLLFNSAHVWAKPILTWGVLHWPPLMILKGEDKGQGRYDLYLKLFQEQMTGYEHVNQEMNWKRQWRDIKNGQPICNILSFKNPARELIAEFSYPTSITLPNRIIVKKQLFEHLGKPTSLSFVELMANKQYSGILQFSRSYTATLDLLLEAHEEGSNITRSSVDSEHLVKMLLIGRFDYLVEYPYIANYLARQHIDLGDNLVSIAIKEMQAYSIGHLACPKTAFGKQVIIDYNRAFINIKDSKKYQELMESWHYNDQEIESIRRGYQDMLDKSGH